VDSSVRIDQVIERGDRRELRLASAKSLESASAETCPKRNASSALLSDTHIRPASRAGQGGYRARHHCPVRGLAAGRRAASQAGDIAMADVARLRVDALRAQNDARATEAEQRRAQLALAYMIGAEGRAIGNSSGGSVVLAVRRASGRAGRRADRRAPGCARREEPARGGAERP